MRPKYKGFAIHEINHGKGFYYKLYARPNGWFKTEDSWIFMTKEEAEKKLNDIKHYPYVSRRFYYDAQGEENIFW